GVLQRMLAKNPADRYQVPQDVVAALNAVTGQQRLPTAPAPAAPVQGHRRRRRKLIIGSLLLLALLVLIGVWMFGPPARRISNSVGMEWVLIPAGTFAMGSPDSEVSAVNHEAIESPLHEVAISRPFYLGVSEVTVGQFRRFVQKANYQTEGEKDGKGALRLG